MDKGSTTEDSLVSGTELTCEEGVDQIGSTFRECWKEVASLAMGVVLE